MTLRRNRKGEWASFWAFVERIEAEVAKLPAWQKGALQTGKRATQRPATKTRTAGKTAGRREEA